MIELQHFQQYSAVQPEETVGVGGATNSAVSVILSYYLAQGLAHNQKFISLQFHRIWRAQHEKWPLEYSHFRES